MNQVLAQLELVSHVKAASLGSETSRLKPGSSPPPGKPVKLKERLTEQFRDADNDWDRMMVLRKAQQILDEATRPKAVSLRRGTKEWKAAIAKDTRASAQVGRDYGISASYVRRIRARQRLG